MMNRFAAARFAPPMFAMALAIVLVGCGDDDPGSGTGSYPAGIFAELGAVRP